MQNYSIYPKQFNDSNMKIIRDTCFIIMKFGKSTDEIYKTIKMALESCNVKYDRSDEVHKSLPFLNKIISSIRVSNYLIVDISGLNANVLYELGIAHTLRDADRILILKDDETECPSDLKHINYFVYSKNSFSELYQHVVNFIKNSNYYTNLIELLSLHNLMPENCKKAFKNLDDNMKDYYSYIIDILNNNLININNRDINVLLIKLFENINTPLDKDISSFYLQLLNFVLYKAAEHFDLSIFIDECFKNDSGNKTIIDAQAEVINILLKKHYYSKKIFDWIELYLKSSSPASVDLIRYKLQFSLINNDYKKIDTFLLNILNNSSSETLIEHSLNVCKEKEIQQSVSIALKIIEYTENPYVFRSAIDLITELGTLGDILNLLEKIDSRSTFVSKFSFINIHIDKANKKVKNL